MQTERTFISIYVVFVLTVFIADVYHRAIMLPRLQRQQEKRENERQVAAEKWASSRAGDALNSVAGGTSASVGGLEIAGNFDTGVGLERSSSAPPQLQDGPSPEIGNRALDAVLLALSNYGENDNVDDVDINDNRPNGWGIESTTEGNQSWDRPVVLHGPDGILTRHHHHQHTSTDGEYNEEDEFHSPYRVMEDMDLVDRLCVQEGSLGFPNINWSGAFQDGKQELMVHFRESWMNIFDDEENGLLDKFLLICEFPLTVCRKVG